ncbi:PREDICTED: uncharacterized protein LOC104808624 isoform X2 [Tarenaya hassleriana]|uniref:uncharacterized protein LOC104808624 isoform X2 n=1 Tax=Tarenaya hassleriana TaxID=28532 RepID=UPI00053C88A5|nr:PREDICTED: uncharacterized protein LOC104808624 isoform X2 [Tarenaya hassleriana]
MAGRFFPAKENSVHGNRRRETLTLLCGPPSSGKTSLLFQFAHNVASDSSVSASSHVVFICHQRRMAINPPFLCQGIDSSSDVFDRIQMKYVDDDDGIRKYFAAFHLHVNTPAAVIIDDFGDYFSDRNRKERPTNSRARDMAMVRTLALCRNAIAHAKKAPCQLILSETSNGDPPKSLFIYKRWVPSIYTIKGDGNGSFLLRSNDPSEKFARYSIALQYLILEEMVDDNDS